MTDKQRGRPTIRDVAERAGVSMQTVSNVINDRPVTRPETRLRVEHAIRELGYERDALARRSGSSAATYSGSSSRIRVTSPSRTRPMPRS